MIFDFQCPKGHIEEHYLWPSENVPGVSFDCGACGEKATKIFSPGKGLLWFEEGRPRTICNLGPEPITITSHKQHREAMKKAGVTEAGASPSKTRFSGRVSEKGKWL